MDARPEPPPEGVLISAALKDARISVREASRRAGISDGWWRQIVNGYQSLSGGSFGTVRAPAETLARMALVAGVTPERMASEGQRPDAAGEMERLRDQPHSSGEDAPEDGRRLRFAENEGIDAERLRPYIEAVRRDIANAVMRYGTGFTGPQAFPDARYESAVWSRESMAASDREELIAIFRYFAAEGTSLENGEDSGGRQTGLCRG